MARRRFGDEYPPDRQWSEKATVVGRGFRFEGEILADDVVIIGGRVDGSVTTPAMVHVLAGAGGNGPIEGGSVLIEGAVDGDITAAEHCELRHSGRVRGNILGPRVAVAEGAYLQGRVRATDGGVHRFRERRR